MLVDAATGSVGELLAAALKDYQAATIVGEKGRAARYHSRRTGQFVVAFRRGLLFVGEAGAGARGLFDASRLG